MGEQAKRAGAYVRKSGEKVGEGVAKNVKTGKNYGEQKRRRPIQVENDMTEEQKAAVDNEQTIEQQPSQPGAPQQPAGTAEPGDEGRDVDEDSTQEQPDLSEVPADFEPTVESVVEAVLFASDEPLSPARLADVVGTGVKQVRTYVKSLNEKYEANGNAFRIEQIAGGYQMLTLGGYNHWLKKLLRVRDDSKLSQPALETLAIIAYKQPIMRADIEAIRGVAAGEMIRNLMYKGLVKIVGRAEVLGRPMLYGTTRKFLETFGLNSIKDLPKIEELKRPD